MSARVRHYTVMAATALLAFGLTRVGSDWSEARFYAATAGLIAVVGLVGNFWIEFAPDGAFRRQSPSR